MSWWRRERPDTGVQVKVLPDPRTGPLSTAGAVKSVQEAEIEVPAELMAEIWQPEYLERLAHAYWRYLTRVSLGLIRIFYARDSRTIGVLTQKIPLLRFRRPEYVAAGEMARVTWRIERGILVVPSGRGQGFLRIGVRRLESDDAAAGTERVLVRTEVSNFYPFIRGGGIFARIGVWIYNFTQLRIHVWITHGFLRSLARAELPPSPVGALVGLERIADADGDGVIDRPDPNPES